MKSVESMASGVGKIVGNGKKYKDNRFNLGWGQADKV